MVTFKEMGRQKEAEEKREGLFFYLMPLIDWDCLMLHVF